MIESITELFIRDLSKLKKEINSYSDESKFWIVQLSIQNSGGNLTLHLLGNLQHFIGHILGNSGYIRKRESEFLNKVVSKTQLLEEIEQTSLVVAKTLPLLTNEDLAKTYPLSVLKKETTTQYFLLHLLAHFNYHLGQINYHRRLLDK